MPIHLEAVAVILIDRFKLYIRKFKSSDDDLYPKKARPNRGEFDANIIRIKGLEM